MQDSHNRPLAAVAQRYAWIAIGANSLAIFMYLFLSNHRYGSYMLVNVGAVFGLVSLALSGTAALSVPRSRSAWITLGVAVASVACNVLMPTFN